MAIPALDRLRLFLRPPGRGIYTVSSGGGFAARLHQKLYGTDDPKKVNAFWEETLQKIRRTESIVLGVPSDTGAGIMRGANFGPIGIREAYLKHFGSFPKNVLDLGDVIVVPQLLDDEMLSSEQIRRTGKELYPNHPQDLPVSPLSILSAAIDAIHELNPSARVVLLGGDHSVSWPAVLKAATREPGLGLLHLDAHTDLLESRLGVKYCFATWAFHAMRLLKPHHLVQVGIRASGKPKETWMQLYPIHQIWAHEVNGISTIESIVGHFQSLGVQKIYLSNDIDGTDSRWAVATGTPEPNGLTPDFVLSLVERIRKEFTVVGSDIMEVAPPLSGNLDFENETTCVLGAQYLKAQIE